jgi:hypothetical protein
MGRKKSDTVEVRYTPCILQLSYGPDLVLIPHHALLVRFGYVTKERGGEKPFSTLLL